MSLEWLTYVEAGKRLGITAQAARQKSIRNRWPKRTANDGRVNVQVDVEETLASAVPRVRHVSDTRPTPEPIPVEHVVDTQALDALREHVATLKDMLAIERSRSSDLACQLEQLRQNADTRTDRFEHDLAELRVLMEARSMPWWRRLAG